MLSSVLSAQICVLFHHVFTDQSSNIHLAVTQDVKQTWNQEYRTGLDGCLKCGRELLSRVLGFGWSCEDVCSANLNTNTLIGFTKLHKTCESPFVTFYFGMNCDSVFFQFVHVPPLLCVHLIISNMIYSEAVNSSVFI